MKSLRRVFFLAGLATLLFPLTSYAQAVSEGWLKAAAAACGGGISIEVSGDLEATLLRRLSAFKSETSGDYSATDVQKLLQQFPEETRSFEAKSYRECLLTLMQTALNSTGLPPKQVTLKSSIAVAPLEIIKRGQRVVLTPENSVAIGDYSKILTFDSMDLYQGRPFTYYNFSDSETGKQAREYVYQAQLIPLGSECHVVPYNINVELKQVSIISNC